jgi:hypothetical protein
MILAAIVSIPFLIALSCINPLPFPFINLIFSFVIMFIAGFWMAQKIVSRHLILGIFLGTVTYLAPPQVYFIVALIEMPENAFVFLWHYFFSLFAPILGSALGACLAKRHYNILHTCRAARIMKFLERTLLCGAMLLGSVIMLGYISNWLSRGQCEARIAKSMLEHFGLGQRPLYEINLMRHFPAAAADVFRATGLKMSQCDPERPESHGGFPWAEMDSSIFSRPYVITIEWGECDGPLSGAGTHSTFVCFFGRIIRVSHEASWVS